MFRQLGLHRFIVNSIYALVLGFTLISRTVKFPHFAHDVVYVVGLERKDGK